MLTLQILFMRKEDIKNKVKLLEKLKGVDLLWWGFTVVGIYYFFEKGWGFTLVGIYSGGDLLGNQFLDTTMMSANQVSIVQVKNNSWMRLIWELCSLEHKRGFIAYLGSPTLP